MITMLEVTAAIDKLSRVYSLPERAKASISDFATTWHSVLRRLTPVQLTTAVDAYLASEERFFPTPGKLLAMGKWTARPEEALDLAGQYLAWEQMGYKRTPEQALHSPCPVCGAEVGYYRVNAKTGSERLMVLHVASEHWKAGIPFIGRAKVGTCGGQWEWEPPAPAPATEGAVA